MNDAVNDPEVLEMLYWHEGLSMWEMADRLDCSETTVYRKMRQYEIDRRAAGRSDSGQDYKKSIPYRMDRRGYPVWRASKETDGFSSLPIHQLLAIAEGASPHKVFSGGNYHVHHKNGIKFDNRPDNVELLTASKHMELHAKDRDWEELGSWSQYTEDEMLEWINTFVNEFGFVPTTDDIEGWPGPTVETYINRFGGFDKARRMAGWKTPDHSTDAKGRIVKREEPKRIGQT